MAFEPGPFKVDGLHGFTFARLPWKFGGYVATVTCNNCPQDAEAGGAAGEAKLIRWAWAHQCKKVQPEFTPDEDNKLFR